jgi:predicted small integral membrane protein
MVMCVYWPNAFSKVVSEWLRLWFSPDLRDVLRRTFIIEVDRDTRAQKIFLKTV